MAYVPPHKRQSNAQESQSLAQEQHVPQLRKALNPQSLRSSSGRKAAGKNNSLGQRIFYNDNSISRWLAVPLTDDRQLPSSVRLVSVLHESLERGTGDKPLTLVNDHSGEVENMEGNTFHLGSPWAAVAESIRSDLLFSFDNMRKEMMEQSSEETKAAFVARFGKLLFPRHPSLSLNSLNQLSVSEYCTRQLRRVFYTNLPKSYMEYVKNEAVPKLGVQIRKEKELYLVKLADSAHPDSLVFCKCRHKKSDNKLELYKVELNPVRQLVADISCLDSKVDLRLALSTKTILVALTDDEKQSIGKIIDSAILDSNVKAGLRWPLGKANPGGQYSVVGVWHINSQVCINSAVKLKLKEADRFDFLSSAGEVTNEIVLKLKGVTRKLVEKNDAEIFATLQDTLKLIWEHFLAWDSNIVSYEPEVDPSTKHE